LKSKKEVTKSFALWELFLITSEFEQRRKTIYTEVDRKDSSTWSQICAVCIGEVNGIAERIAAELAPAEYKSQQAAEEEQKRQQSLIVAQQNPGLRKIADHRVIDDGDVFAGGQPPDFYNMVGTLAKSFGQYPGSQNPVTPRARKAIEYATDHVLSKEYQVRFRPQDIEKRATGYVAEVLKSPIGLPFRQTFARKIAATIFGTPISNKTNIIHATLVLQKLSVLSLIEDDFGQVQKDIPAIIRTFTAVIQKVETFLRSSAPHWTDVEFMEERDRHVAEVDEVLNVIKAALEEILLKFGEYADALEITKKELREAREASQRLCSRPLVMEEDIAAEIAPAAEVERRSAAGIGRPEMKERRRWGQ
jgi:nucleoporin NDC1